MENRQNIKFGRGTARRVVEIELVELSTHSDLELWQKKESVAADQKSLQQSLYILEQKIKKNPIYKSLPYVQGQFTAIEEQLTTEKKALKIFNDSLKADHPYSTTQQYAFHDRYHEVLKKCMHEVQQSLCLIATIKNVFSKKAQDELQDKSTFSILKMRFDNFKKTPIAFPHKFQPILESEKAIDAEQVKLSNEKNRLLHNILSSAISTTEKIDQLNEINHEYNNKISSLTVHLDKLLDQGHQELVAIAEIDKTLDEFLKQMQMKVDSYKLLFPNNINSDDSLPLFLPNNVLNDLRAIFRLVSADAMILNNSSSSVIRSAQLCLREKTYDLEGLKRATLKHKEAYAILEKRLMTFFADLAKNTLTLVTQAQAQFPDTDDKIEKQFKVIKDEVEKLKADVKIASVKEWQSLLDYKMSLKKEIDKAKIFSFKKEVTLWQLDLNEHSLDDVCQKEYNELINDVESAFANKKDLTDVILSNARNLFAQLVKRDKELLATRLEQRKNNIFTVDNCITEIIEKIKILTDDPSAQDREERSMQAKLLETIKDKLIEHKNDYLTKLLGGKSEDKQLQAFCQKAKDILEEEFVQKKILEEISRLYPHSGFVEWLRKVLRPVYRFFYTTLKHKTFYSQFWPCKLEKDLVALMEKRVNELKRSQVALGA